MARPSRIRNLSCAAAAGLAGFATVAFTGLCLLAGLWLDAQVGTRGPFTIILLLSSIPVSLLVMTRAVVAVVRHLQPPLRETSGTEEG